MVKDVKDLEVYKLAFSLTQLVWDIVSNWGNFEKRSMGEQLMRASDLIGANLAEGFGRFHYKDNQKFCYYARGSLEESKHWLRIAIKRGLVSNEQLSQITPLLEELSPKLNAYIKSVGKSTDSEIPPMTSDK